MDIEPQTNGERDGKGRFVKGHKQLGHRVKGVPNKYTAEIRDILATAGANIGFDGKGKNGLLGFFEKLGRDNPEALAVHIVRANCPVPRAEDDPGNTPGPITFNIVAVPNDRYLSREQIKALEQPRLIVDNDEALARTAPYNDVAATAEPPPPAPEPEPEPAPPLSLASPVYSRENASDDAPGVVWGGSRPRRRRSGPPSEW